MTLVELLQQAASESETPNTSIEGKAADLIERQAAQIEMMREALSRIEYLESENGCIMSAGDCSSVATEALSTTPDQALEQFAAKVREQCVMECEKIIGGKVKNEQWWYGFRAGVSQSISVINKLKELPK